MSDLNTVGNVAVAALAVGGSFAIISRVYPEAAAWLSFVGATVLMAFVLLLATVGPGSF